MSDENKDKNPVNELEVKKILLEKFKLAATIQDNYNALFWTRTTVFFAINTALFAAYGLVVTKILEIKIQALHGIPFILILIIFSIVGALLSVLWLQIHKRATYLQEYYRFRASVIENAIGIEPEIFGKSYRIGTRQEKWKPELKITKDKWDNWEDIYGNEGETKKNEWDAQVKNFGGKELKNERGNVPSGLRKKLDTVYIVLLVTWIFCRYWGLWYQLYVVLKHAPE